MNSKVNFTIVKTLKIVISSTTAGVAPFNAVKRDIKKLRKDTDILFQNAFDICIKFIGSVEI